MDAQKIKFSDGKEMRILLPPLLNWERSALAVVGLHGCTDVVVHKRLVPLYLTATFPWPATTACFFACSVMHFAEDVGRKASVAAHVALSVLAFMNYTLAVRIALIYIAFIHVPLHYARCVRHGMHVSVFGVLVVLTSIILSMPPLPNYELADWTQRVICVHTIVQKVGFSDVQKRECVSE